MKTVRLLGFVAGTACALLLAGLTSRMVRPAGTHAANGVLLSGTVKSESGEKLGGVPVSAKADGQTITRSVYTDEQGNYYFPPLPEGKYRVWAQADTFGRELDDVALDGSAHHQDFTLKPLKDFYLQLTGDQVLNALPEDTADHRKMKEVFINNCTGCHQPNYILQNRFDKQGWLKIIYLMSKMNNGGNSGTEDIAPWPIIQYYKNDLAAYLSEIRGPGPSIMQIKVRPRPSGDAARVVVTEWDIPTETGGAITNDGSDWQLGTPSSKSRMGFGGGPHDSYPDLNGNIYFTNPGASPGRTVGRVDAQTGKVTSIKIAGTVTGRAAGSHGITRDKNGIIWFNVIPDGPGAPMRLARIDPSTQDLKVFTPPKGMMGVGETVDVDGKGNIWAANNEGAIVFDPNTQKFTEFKANPLYDSEGFGRTYGVTGDSEGNGWFAQMAIDFVGKADLQSGTVDHVAIAPRPFGFELTPEERKMYDVAGSDWNSTVPWAQGPRRLGSDKTGKDVWVCDWWGNNIARINIDTNKDTLYPLPVANVGPYASLVDSKHNVWINLTHADQVARLDPKTGNWTLFSLPTLGAETRHIAILERDGKTSIFVPYSRAGKVARIDFRSKEDLEALRTQAQELARNQ